MRLWTETKPHRARLLLSETPQDGFALEWQRFYLRLVLLRYFVFTNLPARCLLLLFLGCVLAFSVLGPLQILTLL